MRIGFIGIVVAILAVAGSGLALAQASASFRLEESSFTAGGHPGPGENPASGSHRVTLGALGESFESGSASSPSFRLDGNLVSAYAPPGETLNLRFSLPDKVTLTWNAERSAGDYNLYRGALSSLTGLGYGACLQQHLQGSTTTDIAFPSAGNGIFYLVTVENRLDEEGTKGFASSGARRVGFQCP